MQDSSQDLDFTTQSTKEVPEVPEGTEVKETTITEEGVEQNKETETVKEEVVTTTETVPEEVKKEEVVQPTVKEITEQDLFKALSEKLGKEVTSFEQLKQEPVQVENPLDSDPVLKSLYEFRKTTGRPVEDFFKFNKDYSKVSDLEVVREYLTNEFPDLTNEEISLELRKYIPTEDDLDEEISTKSLELKKMASKGRRKLTELTKEYGNVLGVNSYPEEVREELLFAKQVKEQMEANKQNGQAYVEGINKASNELDVFKLSLDDQLTLDFKVPVESKKDIPSFIDTMPHWRNEDGSFNHKNIIEDAVKIKHFEEMIKLAYRQGESAGKEALLKETKNSNFTETTTAESQTNKGGIEIEGFDNYIGNQGMRMRFGGK